MPSMQKLDAGAIGRRDVSTTPMVWTHFGTGAQADWLGWMVGHGSLSGPKKRLIKADKNLSIHSLFFNDVMGFWGLQDAWKSEAGGVPTGKSFRVVPRVRACARVVWMPSGNGNQIEFTGLPLPFSLLPWDPFPFPLWDLVSPSESKWIQVNRSESKRIQMNPSESKLVQVSPSDSSEWSECKRVQVSPSGQEPSSPSRKSKPEI